MKTLIILICSIWITNCQFMMRIKPIVSHTVIKVAPNPNDLASNQDPFNPLDILNQLVNDNSNIIDNVIDNSKPIFATKVIIKKRPNIHQGQDNTHDPNTNTNHNDNENDKHVDKFNKPTLPQDQQEI